ncbi:MAG: hypothetical protein K2X94_03595 [Amoebophilaceae bacterium]|nr:hypothetical protein [Amoebophilaceae bacterium]
MLLKVIAAIIIAIPLLAEQSTVSYSAKQLETTMVGSQSCKKLKGDVVFTFQPSGMVLTADEACKYEDQNLIEACGNVKIIDKSGSTIQSGRLTYYPDKQLATLSDNVLCQSDQQTFHTSKLIYNVAKKRGEFLGGGKLLQGEMSLTSVSGIYDGGKKMIFFNKEVVLKDPTFTFYGNQLSYHTKREEAIFTGDTKIVSEDNVLTTQKGGSYLLPKKQLLFNFGTLTAKDMVLQADQLEIVNLQDFKAIGHVSLEMKTHAATITGETANYAKAADKIEITGHPLLTKEVNNTTMYLRADCFKASQKVEEDGTKQGEIHALHNVKLYEKNVQCIADGAVYNSAKKVIELQDKPIIWCSGYQITGEGLYLSIEEEEQAKMCVSKNLFIVAEDLVGNYNQIKANKMVASFKEGVIQQMHIEGNSESLYFILAENKELVGMNYIKCSNLDVTMTDNVLESMQFNTKPIGTFYPAEKLNIDQMTLTDFVWHGDKRPTQEMMAADIA